jgi:hypothetical protein
MEMVIGILLIGGLVLFTEVSVGAGISTVLFVACLFLMRVFRHIEPDSHIQVRTHDAAHRSGSIRPLIPQCVLPNGQFR